MASIRRIERKNGKVVWQISYWAPQEDGTKKRKRICYDKKKIAENELAKRVSLIAEKKYLVAVGKQYMNTLGDLCGRYKEAFQHQASYHSSKKYYIEGFKAHWGEKTVLAYITYYELEKYRNLLIAKPTKHNKTRTVRAVNAEIELLRHMFRKARSWNMVEKDPFYEGGSLKLKGENQPNRFLTEKEIPALLLASAPHLQPIIESAIHLGTRAGKEILGVRWGDIDKEKAVVRISRAKTGNVDNVPINSDLKALFDRLRPIKAKSDAHVFLYKGRPIKSVRRSFKTALKQAGIRDFRFHDLRHTCASHLIMRGANLKEVQTHLGHSNVATTNRYLHLTDEAKQKTANRLSGITSQVAYGRKREG
jgi:integrase